MKKILDSSRLNCNELLQVPRYFETLKVKLADITNVVIIEAFLGNVIYLNESEGFLYAIKDKDFYNIIKQVENSKGGIENTMFSITYKEDIKEEEYSSLSSETWKIKDDTQLWHHLLKIDREISSIGFQCLDFESIEESDDMHTLSYAIIDCSEAIVNETAMLKKILLSINFTIDEIGQVLEASPLAKIVSHFNSIFNSIEDKVKEGKNYFEQ